MSTQDQSQVGVDPSASTSEDGLTDLDLIDQEIEDEDEDVDPSRLPLVARRALTTLLTSRFITRSRNRVVWDAILAYEDEIRERLSDLFLHLVVDREYEVAFKRQDPREDAPKLLRRDKPISRDATLLLLNLRKEHMYSDAVDGTVVVARAQAAEFLRPFREDGDADEARFERRVDTALRVLVDLRLLTPDADVDYLYLVSPAVVPLVGVEEVLRLEQFFLTAGQEPDIETAEQSETATGSTEAEEAAEAADDQVDDVAAPEEPGNGADEVRDEPLLLTDETLDVAGQEKA